MRNASGDRPVEITLRRAWDALSWRRRMALVVQLLRSSASSASQITPAKLEAMQQDDAMANILQELSAKWPEVPAIFFVSLLILICTVLQRVQEPAHRLATHGPRTCPHSMEKRSHSTNIRSCCSSRLQALALQVNAQAVACAALQGVLQACCLPLL